MSDPSSLMHEVIVAAHRLTRIAARATGSTTPSAVWSTLSILSTDGAMRIGDLAQVARVSQPSMTKLLQHMVDDELVDRLPDADDSRAWFIAITAKGTTALVAWRIQLSEQLAPLFSDLTAEETSTLRDAARILSARTKMNRKVA